MSQKPRVNFTRESRIQLSTLSRLCFEFKSFAELVPFSQVFDTSRESYWMFFSTKINKLKDNFRRKTPASFRSPKQLKLIKELFDTLDADGGGTIDVEEAVDFYTYLCEKHFHIKKDEETMMAVFQVL